MNCYKAVQDLKKCGKGECTPLQKKAKKAVVIHSGGMDSSICLALAIREFGKENVVSLSFSYHQRHTPELLQAEKIAQSWEVDHEVIFFNFIPQVTHNALIDASIPIEHLENRPPNTLVVGRNGLMVHVGAIYAENLGAHYLYTGIIELDMWNSGYRDCSRAYMDAKQALLKIDLDDPLFEIRTPLVFKSKDETLEMANELGVLDFLLRETITCYEGIPLQGCRVCPACHLRNEGIIIFTKKNPNVTLPYSID